MTIKHEQQLPHPNIKIQQTRPSAALILLAAGPAFAAAGDTTTTFAITAGALTFTVPAGPVALGSGAATVAAQTIGPFALGSVAVTDGCGGVAGWVASVISTAFTGGSGTPATAITYTPTTATKTGTVTVTPASPVVDLTTVKPVQTATAVNGANTGAWSPTLTVAVPAGAQAATYSATVTHSVA